MPKLSDILIVYKSRKEDRNAPLNQKSSNYVKILTLDSVHSNTTTPIKSKSIERG
jgi:hypothetical protein